MKNLIIVFTLFFSSIVLGAKPNVKITVKSDGLQIKKISLNKNEDAEIKAIGGSIWSCKFNRSDSESVIMKIKSRFINVTVGCTSNNGEIIGSQIACAETLPVQIAHLRMSPEIDIALECSLN